jgi:Uncharacterized conserved protein
MALSDYTSNMNYARSEGIQQGIQQGIQEGIQEGRIDEKLEIARNLKLLGVSADLIIKSTGLSQEEIAKL